jgi:cyclic pyranopterin phosphate synthase
MTSPLLDARRRPLESLRVSITDRCNLRCRYCMPEEEYVWLPRQSLLTYEEIGRLVAVFGSLGVSKVRITGGEPLLRRDIAHLVRQIKRSRAIRDLAITTNGVLLGEHAATLVEAGMDRVTVSLDTLQPERFRDFAGRGRLDDVLTGIDAAAAAGLTGTKLNTVVIRGFNEDEVPDILAFAAARGVEARFIEYMDVGGATQWSIDQVVTRAEILQLVGERLGPASPVGGPDREAPAERFRLPDGTMFGIIASTTAPFCGSCGRSRLTADGMWYLCLYADEGTDLRALVRSGASDDAIAAAIREGWSGRTDRGAEERLTAPERGPLYRVDKLRQDPHREMHTRGG